MRRGLAATAAGGLVFLFVWEQVQATRVGFELDRTRRAVREAEARNAYLRLELERRTAPAELALLARERLGMLPPSPDSVVLLAEAAARPTEAPQALGARAPEALGPIDGLGPAAEPRGWAAEPPPRLRAGAGAHLLGWLLPPDAPRGR